MYCDAGDDSDLSDETVRLVWEYLDDMLPDEEIERLEKLLLASDAACEFFTESCLMHTSLYRAHGRFVDPQFTADS